MAEVRRTRGELAVAGPRDCWSFAWNGCGNGDVINYGDLARFLPAPTNASVSNESARRGRRGRLLESREASPEMISRDEQQQRFELIISLMKKESPCR
jgi:hypothetical protein